MNIGLRLKEWRAHRQLKQNEASSLLGVPYSTYQKYELNNKKPGADAMEAFCRAGINTNWLLTGEGLMLSSQPQDYKPKVVDDTCLQLAIENVEDLLHESNNGSLRAGERSRLISMAYIFFDENSDNLTEQSNKVIKRMLLSSISNQRKDTDHKREEILTLCKEQGLQEWRKEYMKTEFKKELITELDEDQIRTLYLAVMSKK